MRKLKMTRNYKLKRNSVCDDPYELIPVLIKKNKGTLESFGVVAGLGGGILTALLVIILSIIPWSMRISNIAPAIKAINFICLLLILPLLALGAHCLDLLEKRSTELPVIRLQSVSYNCPINSQNRTQADAKDLGLRS
jgi:hypothetical protein